MGLEYAVLGPIRVLDDGVPLSLGGARQRAVLAALLLHAGEVVPVDRLIEDVWGAAAPDSASNLVQGYVSALRKLLGRSAIETCDPGYVIRPGAQQLDLYRFEHLAGEGNTALLDGRPGEAVERFAAALALWRGPALPDLPADGRAHWQARRLDELRRDAAELLAQARLDAGRPQDAVPDLTAVVAEHPHSERALGLLMTALYRSGRQADALAEYRAGHDRLVEDLGIEPGPALQELEQAILRHDLPRDRTPAAPDHVAGPGPLLLAAFDLTDLDTALSVVTTLATGGSRDLVVAVTATDPATLLGLTGALESIREQLADLGVAVRTAAFTSSAPGIDLARLAREQAADLVVVPAPRRALADDRLAALLEQAPCDVAVLVGGRSHGGPVVVPFTGAEHDWAAVELAAWVSRTTGGPLQLLGTLAHDESRDASRLLANASLAVQRVLGVTPQPRLVTADPGAVVAATADAGLVVVGLTDRWRTEGVGTTRTALAACATHPTLLVRRGTRPGGLAPRDPYTRFTWTMQSAR